MGGEVEWQVFDGLGKQTPEGVVSLLGTQRRIDGQGPDTWEGTPFFSCRSLTVKEGKT